METTTDGILDWWYTDERVDTIETSGIYNLAPQTFNRKRCEGEIMLDVFKLGTDNFYRRSQAQKDALSKVKIQKANQPD